MIDNIATRATRAVIDLDAIAGNIRAFVDAVTPGTRVMAIVKANAYGHGAVAVSRAALDAGASWLGVATVDEGIVLRRAGILAPILVIGPIDPSEAPAAVGARLALAIGDSEPLVALERAAESTGAGPVEVHIKIDTGMRRFGVMPSDALAMAKRLIRSGAFRLGGVFTHFARSDETDETPTRIQAQQFDEAVASITAAGIHPGIVHAANSAAALRSRRYDYDLVRIGIALYGLPPSDEIGLWPGMRPALSIRSRIRRVFTLQPGDGVGYGATYRASQAERVALVPIGYADGYSRKHSNRSWMGLAGHRAPVAGRVCMDQTVVRVPDEVEVEPGSEIVVLGDGREGAPTAEDLARLAETNPYEVVTALAARVPRWYVRNGDVVAVETLTERVICGNS